MTKLGDYLRLGRPLFLGGGVIFHALGVSIALFQHVPLNFAALVWGQMAITAVQLMTHYSNDYFDFAADRANNTPSQWSGGSRMLVEGRVSVELARATAVAWGLTAFIVTLILGVFIQPAWATIPLLLLSLFLAWEYSAPPLQFHSHGVGAVIVALIVPTLTPLIGYYLQAGHFTRLTFLASFPLALLQMAMILVIDFPDAQGDRLAGKKTLVVRLGTSHTARLYVFLLGLVYLLLPSWLAFGLPSLVGMAVLLPLPLAGWLGWQMSHGAWQNPTQWNKLGFASVVLLMVTAVLVTAVFLILAIR